MLDAAFQWFLQEMRHQIDKGRLSTRSWRYMHLRGEWYDVLETSNNTNSRTAGIKLR